MVRVRRRAAAIAAAAVLTAAGLVIDQLPTSRAARVRLISSAVRLRDGSVLTATNHLVPRPVTTSSSTSPTTEYLVVWAGDWNAGDGTVVDNAPPGPDFLAVVGADGADEGKVVNTFTVDGAENEPHHMQYAWRAGDRIYAGALFTDRTFVFDVSDLPTIRLVGVNEPLDTPCGSVPDAYWVLSDGTAYGTYMGGPDVAADPRCNGGINNGFAGTPGEVVHIGTDGRTLGEFGADGGTRFATDSRRPNQCVSTPVLARPSCANPHGIAVREDLGIMVTSDYAEPRNVPIAPVPAPNPNVFRDTVRTWRFARAGSGFDFNQPELRSVSAMPLGAMGALPPDSIDPRGFMGIMETTLTHPVLNSHGTVHKGAFASSMCGGAIYYTADITALHPMWRQVFEATAAAKAIDYPGLERVGCAGAGWLATSPDDHVLFQAVIGRNPHTFGAGDPGLPKMVYALDVSQLVDMDPSVWVPENPAVCTITTAAQAENGGPQPTCPHIAAPGANVLQLPDDTTGGPHWGAIDNLTLSSDPGRLTSVTRIAASNYFVGRAGIDGNHRVCLIDVSAAGALSLDTAFVDENTGQPCVDFNRTHWPHGDYGWAKPHSMLFVASG